MEGVQGVTNTDRMADVSDLLAAAPRILVLTGAGMSAESGIPTFRGSGERWRGKHFSELASLDAFSQNPREIWEWYLYRRNIVATCSPHAGHHALAAWMNAREGITLTTQNVDDLHEQVGSEVIRLHGSLWRNRCLECGMEREDRSLAYPSLPISPCCGMIERPAIVWFQEQVPFAAFDATLLAAIAADAILVIGTSGAVSPTAAFLHRARANGTRIIDINPEGSHVPATISLRGTAAVLLPVILQARRS